MASEVPNGYQLRQCRSLEELKQLDTIALCVEFHLGLHNWILLFETSADSVVFVTTAEDKVVGFITINRAIPNFLYRHQILMLPEFRKGNFMRKYFQWERSTDSGQSASIGFNANSISLQKIFVDRPYIVDYKQVGFEGYVVDGITPDPKAFGYNFDGRVELLGPSTLPPLIEYDRQLYSGVGPCPKRQEFMRKYVTDGINSQTLIALSSESSQLVGYGVIRIIDAQEGYYRLSPVYADNLAVGFSLLCALAARIPPHVIFYLAFPAKNLASLQFCHQMKLRWEYSEFRVYEKSVLNLPIEKMFAEQEFWPL